LTKCISCRIRVAIMIISRHGFAVFVFVHKNNRKRQKQRERIPTLPRERGRKMGGAF
jgi:hypothetical protein